VGGLVVCTPLGLLLHNLQRSEQAEPPAQAPQPVVLSASHSAPHAAAHSALPGGPALPLAAAERELGKAEPAQPARAR
jgi:hypothetical protein